MKKIFTLFALVIFAISFNSCSSDDNESTDLTAKINGVSKKFINITVTEEEYDGYSDYVINAIQSDAPTATLRISLGKEVLGTESIYFVQYFDGENYFQLSDPAIVSNITESSGAKIKGSFSGVLVNDLGLGTVTIAEGSIDVKH